jgi:hypothetical protein
MQRVGKLTMENELPRARAGEGKRMDGPCCLVKPSPTLKPPTVASSGCQWHASPNYFPTMTTVQRYFDVWRDLGLFMTINHR